MAQFLIHFFALSECGLYNVYIPIYILKPPAIQYLSSSMAISSPKFLDTARSKRQTRLKASRLSSFQFVDRLLLAGNRRSCTLWLCQNSYGKWSSRNSGFTDLPIENGGSFHRFLYVYQRVTWGLSSDLEFQLSNLWTVDPSHRFRPLRDPHRSRTWENFSHGMVAWLRRRGP